ncbi:MAG: AarF/UbiB family protein [Mycolicibacterium sp.]
MIEVGAPGSGGFAPYQVALAQLQTEAPPMHLSLLHQVLSEELGPPGTHFARFEDKPVAAASIGQQ